MNHLPVEVKLLIFGHLGKIDLKNIRLVSSYCCGVATELLFDRIFISGREKDVTVFSEWSASKRCSPAVKELVFDMSLMDPSLSKSLYMAELWYYIHDCLARLPREVDFQGSDRAVQQIIHHIRTGHVLGPDEHVSDSFGEASLFRRIFARPLDLAHEFGNTPTSALCDNPIVVEGYERYICEAKFEEDMRTSGELLVRLVRGLENLPRISCVRVEERGLNIVDAHNENFDAVSLSPFFTQDSPFRRSWHPLYLLPFDRFNGERDNGGALSDLSVPYIAHFHTLIRALSLSKKSISQMQLGSVDVNTFPVHDLDWLFCGSQTLNDHSHFVMSNLESLTLHSSPPEYLPEKEMKNYYAKLRQHLLTLPNLTRLDLDNEALSSACLDFTQAFPRGLVLPKLRHLRIFHLWLASEDFVNFMSSHDLDSIVLEYVILKDTDPIDGFHSIYQALQHVPKVRIQEIQRELQIEEGGNQLYMVLELTVSSAGPIITRLGNINDHPIVEIVDIDLSSHAPIDLASKQNALRVDPPLAGPRPLTFHCV